MADKIIMSIDPAKSAGRPTNLTWPATPDAMTFKAWNQRFLEQIASGLGLSYDQMAHNYLPGIVTPKMIRLGASPDRRQRKRAWRIYYRLNGRGASVSSLRMAIQWEKARRSLAEVAVSVNKAAEQMAGLNRGLISLQEVL